LQEERGFRDGKPQARRLPLQMGPTPGPTKEKTMPTLRTSTPVILALVGAISATVVLAQEAPEGQPPERGEKFMELFDTIDANGDGLVTMAELEAHRLAEFAAADTNKDGAVDADEVAARELARFTERLPERAARMIKVHDNDGNGTLSADEVEQGPAERHFARIDSDDDGAISKAEAEAAAERMKKQRKGKRGDDN
jgi:EF hand